MIETMACETTQTHQQRLDMPALNRLIAACGDCEAAYTRVASSQRLVALESLFAGYADQRALFIDTLRAAIGKEQERESRLTRQNAGAPDGGYEDEDEDEVTLITCRHPKRRLDRGAIMLDCERSERVAMNTYESVLCGDSLPSSMRGIIEAQHSAIKKACEALCDLRSSPRAVNADGELLDEQKVLFQTLLTDSSRQFCAACLRARWNRSHTPVVSMQPQRTPTHQPQLQSGDGPSSGDNRLCA